MSKRKQKNSQAKRFVKFLAVCRDPKAVSSTIKAAPDKAIKLICNAALNAQRGNIKFGGSQLAILKKNKRAIFQLVNPKKSIKYKRKILSQRGGFSWIPVILSTVLGTLGSALFGNKQQ